MSVAVCRGPVAMPPAFQPSSWLQRTAEIENTYNNNKKPEVVADDDHHPAQVDIWNAIQADAVDKVVDKVATKKPYVHPLMHRSSSKMMSQKSLEVCTESLGSETGSGDFTASLDDLFGSPAPPAAASEESFWRQGGWEHVVEDEEEEAWEGKELAAVNYHCSGWTRRSSSPARSFPPPLPSMSSRDKPCIQMRPRRQDGRLIVDAVVVRPRGYLHATRHGGRLRLSFVESSARDQSAAATATVAMAATPEAPFFPVVDAKRDEEEYEEVATDLEEVDEEEEEVEVVDRGTVVEVKVSTQPQTPTAAKVHRSTLVINKFVGSTPLSVVEHPTRCNVAAAADAQPEAPETTTPPPATPGLRRVPSSTSTTTLAAAVAVASTSTDDVDDGKPHTAAPGGAAADTKQLLLFTSRCRDKQELLQSVRQCRQLRQKPLFILEPYCIATS